MPFPGAAPVVPRLRTRLPPRLRLSIGPDGEAVEDAGVSTHFQPADPSIGSAWGSGRHVQGGSYRVRHPRQTAGQVGAPGSFTLSVRSDLFGSISMPYAGPTVGKLTVRFEEPGLVDVVLRGYERSGFLNRTEFRVTRLVGGRQEHPWLPGPDRPDTTGRWSLGPLAPGLYQIEVVADLEGDRGVRLATVRVQVDSGTQELRIELPRLCFLTLTAASETVYDVRSAAGSPWSYREGKRTGSNGKATFGALPAGEYTIRGRGTGDQGQTMTVRISKDMEVAFEPD